MKGDREDLRYGHGLGEIMFLCTIFIACQSSCCLLFTVYCVPTVNADCGRGDLAYLPRGLRALQLPPRVAHTNIRFLQP